MGRGKITLLRGSRSESLDPVQALSFIFSPGQLFRRGSRLRALAVGAAAGGFGFAQWQDRHRGSRLFHQASGGDQRWTLPCRGQRP